MAVHSVCVHKHVEAVRNAAAECVRQLLGGVRRPRYCIAVFLGASVPLVCVT
jgi:hypothetical protein